MNIPNVTITDEFNINELTQGKLDGNGSFDILMRTILLHLDQEYNKQRIRGTDYANAYIGLINNALNQISNYALQKAKLPLELQLLEAEIQKVATDTILVTKQGGLVGAQIHREMAQTEMLHLEMEYKFPKELAMIDAQIENMKAEIALKDYELKYIKPIQLALQEKELALREKQIQISEKELGIKEQQLALARYEFEVKAPADVKSILAQADLYNQKVVTEKAQTDPDVIKEGSVIDHNNKVLKQQAIS